MIFIELKLFHQDKMAMLNIEHIVLAVQGDHGGTVVFDTSGEEIHFAVTYDEFWDRLEEVSKRYR